MDIRSKNGYPASALSNFAPHPFVIDGIKCASMEGFLQSLKFKNPAMQIEVCRLVGLKAKYKGKKKNWWKDQLLYHQGEAIDRHSAAYQDLIDKAYNALFGNSKFRAALAASSGVFTHNIGNDNPVRTVLTRHEFCSQLKRLYNELMKRSLI